MRNIIYLCIFCFTLASCKTLVPFSSELREENNWKEDELNRIQFYTSETIILNRQLKNNSTNIVSGKVKTVNGRQVEEIIIKHGTPGVVSAYPDAERLAVSFEISDDYFLVFGVDKKRGDRYYLRLKEYEKNTLAKVTYSDQVFDVSPQSLNSYLVVNMKRINKEEKKLRVAKGRKL